MTDLNMENKLQTIRNLAAEFAEAEAKRQYLEHFRHSKLAILMSHAAFDHKTAAAQERVARSHPDYQEFLMGLREAIQDAEHKRWLLRTEMAELECWRTQEASRRSELKAMGG